MRTKRFLKRFIFTAVLSLIAVVNVSAQSNDKQILVGGTDFMPKNAKDSSILIKRNEVEMIGEIEGHLYLFGNEPDIYQYIDTAYYSAEKDAFLSSYYECSICQYKRDTFYKDTTYVSEKFITIEDTTYITEFIVGDSMEVIGIDTIGWNITSRDTFGLDTIITREKDYLVSKFIGFNSHDKKLMVIAKNPNIINTEYINDTTGNWGVTWEGFSSSDSTNKTFLRYDIDKLLPNSPVKLEIKYRSVIDPTSELASRCDSLERNKISFKVAINPSDADDALDGYDVPEIILGEENVYTFNKGTADEKGSYFFNVNMPYQYTNDVCSSLEITSIKVYGTIDYSIYTPDGTTICVGDTSSIMPRNFFKNATYQWIGDTISISKEQEFHYNYTSQEEGTKKFQLKMTYDTITYISNELTISTINCNSIFYNDSLAKKVIFKEDFGEFDLTDSAGYTYKVWDYTDFKNPVQITKQTETPFRYELDKAPLGYSFSKDGPINDGEYTVAGVLTGYNPMYVPGYDTIAKPSPYQPFVEPKGFKGAQLQWANRLHGIDHVTNSYNVPFDHSGTAEGCCLFVNIDGNYDYGKTIYERYIRDICENSFLSFECYISIFTDSGYGEYYPVDVTFKASEVGNSNNTVEKRATQTIPNEGGTGDWVKISGNIYLEKGNEIKIEIVNNGIGTSGNDLVIDDIIISTYIPKSINASFEEGSLVSDTIISYTAEDSTMIYAQNTTELTSTFGENVNYLYQWSVNPYGKDSWNRICDPTAENRIKIGSKPFEGLKNKDKVYFRIIAGNDSTLSKIDDKDFKSNDPCNTDYKISELIVYTIKLPDCTNPAENIKITSDIPATGLKRNKDVIELCYGESVTLSQNADITPEKSTWEDAKFAGYAIKWFVDEKPGEMSDASVVMNDVVGSMTSTYNNIKLGGTESSIVLYAVDALYLDGACKSSDTIFIKFIESPKATFRNPEANFEEGEGEGVVDFTLTEGTVLDYTIHWWKGQDTLTGISIGDDKSKKFFEGLTAENSGTYSYQLVDINTGCAGEIHNYEVTITSDTLSVSNIASDNNEIVNVYTINGALVKASVMKSNALVGLKPGVYVVGREKVEVKE